MGSELQGKYQKLAQEYAKLRSHVEVLKKAVRDEKGDTATLQESLREKTQGLRKYVQENESLVFRNQQLSKRVAVLQEELNNPSKPKKRKGADGVPPGVASVHAQELSAKIAENERLHMKVLELTQKSERTISSLETKVTSLEQEVSSHNSVLDDVCMKHKNEVQSLQTERAMVEARLAKLSVEVEEQRTSSHSNRNYAGDDQLVESGCPAPEGSPSLLRTDDCPYGALNVPVIDTKLQSEVMKSLHRGLDVVSTFLTQLSTFHSYLEQRCKTYPVDVTAGMRLSVTNQKACELLHGSSSYTKPVVGALTRYCETLKRSPLSQCSTTELEEFASAHQRMVGYLETLTPYLQLSLEEESSESVCGPQLTEKNTRLSGALPHLVWAFSTVDNYLTVIVTGSSNDVPSHNLVLCLEKLKSSFEDVQHALEDICGHFSSKITHEYQLPTTTQKLNTTNECIVSVLTSMISTAEQLSGFLRSNFDAFSSALGQSSLGNDEKPSGSSVVHHLRLRATNYLQRLYKDCPDSVPYTLAVYNAKAMSSSSESVESLMRQMTSNQEKLTLLEQEKEQLTLDLQLLKMIHEKEQKRNTALLQGEPARGQTSLLPSQPALNESKTSLDQTRSLSASVGSLSVVSTEEELSDDAIREALIRKHFTSRISELSAQLQVTDSKEAFYYAECRALHKQLNHNAASKTLMSQELQVAGETVQQLQDQLGTTASNYEKQLSAMSDHVCELNDKLVKQSEELETLRKSKGTWRGK